MKAHPSPISHSISASPSILLLHRSFVIGIEWFTLIDQATTGRWFSKDNGESYNTGLLSVAARPWKAMLAEMMQTNHTIYDLLLGKRSHFPETPPRFRAEPK